MKMGEADKNADGNKDNMQQIGEGNDGKAIIFC